MANWIDPQPVVVSEALREAIGGHPLVAQALARRGITTPAAARGFLDPKQYFPASAANLPDIERATDRIWRALTIGERTAVFGDFDVDGLSATALLVESLRKLSPVIEVPLDYRVPKRDQGHGVNMPLLEDLLGQGVRLLITCDTGVDASVAIRQAAARGCDVIVTDHHDLPGDLPPALAVINPKRLDTGHPLRELPGVGVAYKLVENLFQRAGRGDELGRTLDLVALGIVADVATQVADVRYLLQLGLEVLRTTDRVGLRALMEQAELRPDGLTEEHIGYQLAPRLNALGRLADASQGVELLVTEDLSRARVLAAEMDGLNYKRRLITSQITQAALTQIERDPSLLDYRALVVAGRDWPPGVLGLVAGRLADKFQRPCVVLSVDSEGAARGSARSVPGCDIHVALKRSADLLLRFGGHPRAAGLTLDSVNVEPFRKALSRSVAEIWDPDSASPGLRIDAYVSLDQLSLELGGELERLAPFGPGNPPVQLATRDLHIVEDVVIGRESEHRRLVVVDEQDIQQSVLWWQGADQPLPEGRFDLAYALRARDYRGEMQLQVEWLDARLLEPTTLVSPRPTLAVIDRRGVADPRTELAAIPEPAVVVWAEGDDPIVRSAIGGVDRLGLTPSPVLVIWTSPPGPVELAQAIQAVTPAKIYLFALEPPTAGVRVFLERLVGMVKHDLRKREGRVNVGRVAAALGQREATVRAGLEWLAARGQVQIVEVDEGTMTLQAGGEPSGEATEVEAVESRLRHVLEETAAYRRHFRWAPTQALGIFV